MRRIVGLILVVVLTIFASLAETFRNGLWFSYRDYTSPYVTDLPSGAPRLSATPRVVLVLARGLRLEPSRQMTSLNKLRGQGADVVVEHEPPTFRLPAWTTLLTGAAAETHGVTTNYAPRPTGASSIFRELQQVGDPVAIVGSQELIDAFGDEATRAEVVDSEDAGRRDDEAVRIGLEVLRDPTSPMRLVCIELGALEAEAMAPVSAGDVVTATDTRIWSILDALDLTGSTLVVLSDRGLTHWRTDGGAEPEVARVPLIMAGPGISTGTQLMITAADVAPTLAALTGAPIPVHAQGQIALPVLALPADPAATEGQTPTEALTETLAPVPALLWASAIQATTFYESWSEKMKQPRFAAELLRAHQAGIKAGDAEAYQKFMTNLKSRANAAYSARLDTERTQRLPIMIGAALFLIALSGVALAGRPLQPLIGTAVYIVVWFALYTIVRDQRFSLSMFAGGDPTAFFNGVARDAALLLVAVSVVVAVTTRGHEDSLEALTTVLTTLLLITLAQVVQAVWFYFQWGNDFTWNLPPSPALVTILVAMTQASALSIRIVPELPNLPIPLVVAFLTLIIYGLVRRGQQRVRYGRLR